MNKENFFLKHKILFLVLIITYIVFLCCYWKSAMGLYFDITTMFSSEFYNHTMMPDKLQFLYFADIKIRTFTNMLVSIPLNIALPFIKNQPALTAIKVFTTSYFIIHFVLLILNFLVAKRTKRYDIALIALAFYFLFSIPNAIWVVREIHIAILAQFISLSYFLSKEKLNYWDFIPILIIQIYLFESFETSAAYTLILFIASIFFIKNKKEEQNLLHKALIGITSLAATLYIPIKIFLRNHNSEIMLSSGIEEWISHHELSLKTLFSGNLIIPIFAIIAIIFTVFFKKDCLKGKYAIFSVLNLVLMLTILYFQTGFVSKPILELVYYSPILWLIFPVITYLIISDYKKYDFTIKNSYFYPNLLTITCIFGIFNLLWQINQTNDFAEYKKYLENIMEKSDKAIVHIPEADFNNKILRFYTCFGITTQSLFLQTIDKPAKIIFPNGNESCSIDIINTHYNQEKDYFKLQSAFAQTKTKYWDLTPIKEEFIKTGRVYSNKT